MSNKHLKKVSETDKHKGNTTILQLNSTQQ